MSGTQSLRRPDSCYCLIRVAACARHTARSRRVLNACNGVAGGHTYYTYFSFSLSLIMTDTSHAATLLLQGLPI